MCEYAFIEVVHRTLCISMVIYLNCIDIKRKQAIAYILHENPLKMVRKQTATIANWEKKKRLCSIVTLITILTK